MYNNVSQNESDDEKNNNDQPVQQTVKEKEVKINIEHQNTLNKDNIIKKSKIKILLIITIILLIIVGTAAIITLYIYIKNESTQKNNKSNLEKESIINILNPEIFNDIDIPNKEIQQQKKELMTYIKAFKKIKYENQLIPKTEIISSNGNSNIIKKYSDIKKKDSEYSYYFILEKQEKFKVLQITDVHIRLIKRNERHDKKALRAVAAMISVEKPDLVIFTGDFSSIDRSYSTSNIEPFYILIEMMERLGVYWTIVYGNHDTEFGLYSRKEFSDILENNSYLKNNSKHCLFVPGPTNIYGYGNAYINIKNKNNVILKSLILLDSNEYHTNNRYYDRIHDDQIDWYKHTIQKLNKYNNKLHCNNIVPSETFFHIPINTFYEGFTQLLNNRGKKTKDFERLSGDILESPIGPTGFTKEEENKFINTILELNSTDAMYFGHDHTNNAKIMYKGKVLLSFSLSIDYAIYRDIEYHGRQRGCTLITYTLNQNQSALSRKVQSQWYYQDKYENVSEVPYKREVLQKDFYRKKKFNFFPDFLIDPY